MKLQKIKEGQVEVSVPVGRKYDAPVFYNKDAEFVRDINVAVLSIFKKEIGSDMKILDALSATGISGIRYAKEVGVNAVLNDKNPVAAELIRKNASENNVNVTILNKDANLVMRESLYDFIDVDPFGSPCVFLDSVAHSVKYNRLVAISATDTGALSGSFPNACLRKYGIRATRTHYYNEVGVRVLITAIMNSFMRYNKAFRPLLFLAHKHYYRIWGIAEGTRNIAKQLKHYNYVNGFGPIYLGPIKDNDFIRKVRREIDERNFKMKNDEIKFLSKIIFEIDEPFYYNINKMHLAKVPKIDDIIYELKKKGFVASRSSLCDTGIKTDANKEEFNKLIGLKE